MGCSERTALKQVYYQGWSRSPSQSGCMRKVLRAGALGRPRGMGWGGRREGGSGWGTHINPWLIHVNVWQKPLQYCKVISLQLIKINRKKPQLLICKNFLLQFGCLFSAYILFLIFSITAWFFILLTFWSVPFLIALLFPLSFVFKNYSLSGCLEDCN